MKNYILVFTNVANNRGIQLEVYDAFLIYNRIENMTLVRTLYGRDARKIEKKFTEQADSKGEYSALVKSSRKQSYINVGLLQEKNKRCSIPYYFLTRYGEFCPIAGGIHATEDSLGALWYLDSLRKFQRNVIDTMEDCKCKVS